MRKDLVLTPVLKADDNHRTKKLKYGGKKSVILKTPISYLLIHGKG